MFISICSLLLSISLLGYDRLVSLYYFQSHFHSWDGPAALYSCFQSLEISTEAYLTLRSVLLLLGRDIYFCWRYANSLQLSSNLIINTLIFVEYQSIAHVKVRFVYLSYFNDDSKIGNDEKSKSWGETTKSFLRQQYNDYAYWFNWKLCSNLYKLHLRRSFLVTNVVSAAAESQQQSY